jgi:SHS family lactate transporter-like MFS transporter
MLANQYHYAAKEVTLINVTACLGAIVGGTVAGYASQIFGRRFCIIALCIVGAALLYPYALVGGNGLYAAGFFEWFCVQGAFGVIPIHLVELSPPAYNTLIVGASYNVGVLIAAATNTIQANAATHFPLGEHLGDHAYNYGIVICIFTAIVFVLVILMTFLGPENRRPNTPSDDGDMEDEEVEYPEAKIDSYNPWKSGAAQEGRY